MRSIKKFFQDAWQWARNAFNSIWDGETFLQDNAVQFANLRDRLYQAASSDVADLATDLIPGKFDDRAQDWIIKGLEWAERYLDGYVKLDECLDPQKSNVEKMACLISKIREIKDEKMKSEALDILTSKGLERLHNDTTDTTLDPSDAKALIEGGKTAHEAAKKMLGEK
jgi:hypothetical protein